MDYINADIIFSIAGSCGSSDEHHWSLMFDARNKHVG